MGHFRSAPVNRHCRAASECPKGATFGLMHCGKSTHRVERLDRDARHEACSTRSRATSSTKPAPTAAPREPARRQSAGRQRRPCREATAAVLRRGSPFRDHSSVCRALGNWNSGGRARPTRLPIRILQLSPAAHLCLSPDDTVKHNIRLAVASFWSFVC
jgi:hypothetical protein